MKTINEMTIKKFQAVPHRKSWCDDVGPIDSLIILPTKKKHDSGYRIIEVVAERKGFPLCKVTECSDVLNLGGMSLNKNQTTRWNIDCLPTSGLLRLFCFDLKLTVGNALSSFEIFSKNNK